MALLRLEGQVLPELGPLGDDQGLPFVGQALPDFLGDEGHKRMQQPQHLVQNVDQHGKGRLLPAGILGIQPRLGQLNVPVAVGIPDEVVDLLHCHAQLVLFQILRDLGNQGVQLGEHPLVGNFQLIKLGKFVFGVLGQVHQNIPGGVPQLVGEVAHGLAPLHIETHVVSGRVAGDHVHPQGVAAVFVDHFQRIDAVAQGLGHLAALVVPDQAVDQHRVEGSLSGMLAAGEDHSGHPEEDDVVARHQHIGGIEVVKVLGLFRPAQGLKGPQGGGEPGVQHVGVPLNVGAAALFALAGILPGDSDVAAVGAGPGRDLMAPPQLAGDTPIPDVFHPVQIGLAETVGDELGFALLDHPDGFFCQRLHLHEPLGGNNGLHIPVAAVAGSHVVAVVLHLHQISLLLQVGNNGLPGVVAVHAFILTAQLVDLAVVVQDPDDIQVVPQAHLEVVGVMGGGHLDAAGAEFHLRVVVGHHGNLFVHQGQNDLLTHDFLVALVVGVDADAGIAQHGFRTGGGHHHFPAAVGQGVADVPQVTGLVHILHLRVRQRGDAVGAPVDDPAALIDQALFVQGDKNLPDGLGAALVHGKPCPVPIAGRAQLLLLLHDAVAVLVLPVPHPLQELFPAQVVAGQALLAQLLLYLDLGGDAGVVNAGDPQGVVALHPLETDQGVLQCGIHSVAHVQLSGDVWGRHHDGEGLFALVLLGVEVAALLPHVIDPGLHLLGLIDLW